MATTLADLAVNSNDKLCQGFINEIITDNYVLGAMPFDDCLSTNGQSDLTYAYKRMTAGLTADFRALGDEPTASEVTIAKITTSPAILSSKWSMDRVARNAGSEILALKVAESKDAIIRKFNATLINGDTDTDADGFDGLSKALTDSDTEYTSAVDISTITKAAAMAFASEMDTMLNDLLRTPDVILVSPAMMTKLNAITRELSYEQVTQDTAGKRVKTWDGIRIEVLKDGALTTNDVYAVCFGLNEFHGFTLAGGNAIAVALPDWSTPGAVKSGDSEMVVGCALKNTKAAGVLRAYSNAG